ncbi:MAG: beta-N-acetylhexosaminidase [Pseudomonadales bacterium]
MSAVGDLLMPVPAAVVALDAERLAAGARFAPDYSGVRGLRLERGVHRFLASTAHGRARARVTVPLQVVCAAVSAGIPALDDDEAYTLEVSAAGVRLEAAAEWGILRGLATLTQLCAGGAAVAAQRIVDRPRFPWRGLMIDVARRFMPLATLLRTLDAMAALKLNVLHLHLSDDQGFRLPSRRYPRLSSADHYRVEELQRLVSYAADLGIRVVPELDVPGHTSCWLQAYPDWGCGKAQPSRRFGVHRECLDPTRPAVMEALETLLDELAELFPDAYVHLGGDEVHPQWWSDDPAIQAYLQQHQLADAAALQARFTSHLAQLLCGRGKRPLGWDEVLHPDVPAAVTVQSWRGATARDRALAAGHDCVVSAHYYLDLCYPMDVHYGFDPGAPEAELLALEDQLLDDPRFAHVAAGMRWTEQWRQEAASPRAGQVPPGRLLGAEACLWSELVDARVLDVRLWSRMPALAERFWSPARYRDSADAHRRLIHVLARLPEWAGVDVAGSSRRLLTAAGVTEPWLLLVAMLEPVKWYGRLLGEQALAARLEGREMPQSRPYDADTPLDRVADALPPESFAAHELAAWAQAEARGDASAGAQLRAVAEGWRRLPASGAGPLELEPLAQRLAHLGELLLGVLDGSLEPAAARVELAAAARPVGEYLLAPVPVLAAWLDARER